MKESRIHWKEISPGKWTRDFDPIEKTLNFLTLASPVMMQFTIAAGGFLPDDELSVEKVKDAWVALRYAHPILACKITGTGFEYQVPTDDELQKWVEETIIVDNSGKTGQDLALLAIGPKTEAAELYFLPDRHEVFILLRHEIIDGIGSVILFNNLLRALHEGRKITKFGDEPALLNPSLTEILHAEDPSPDATNQAHQIAESYMAQRAISLKMKPIDPDMPSQLGRLEHEFSESETSAIVKACKDSGITVTTASTAAVAQAVLEHAGEESGHYCGVGNISIRDLLPAPYNGMDRGVGNLLTTSFPHFPVTTSSRLVELAEQTKKTYNWWKYKKDNVECASAMPNIMEDAFVNAIANGIEPPATVAAIGLGIVERYITEPMGDFWFNLSLSGSTCAMYVYTAKSRLRFVLCYNSTFHDEESMNLCMHLAVRFLNEGLGLKVVGNH
ncbi:hypothetical protein Dda_6145 [Drechslerella dactyloides]|uniref:Condensation domain-containing protein n=1 Tax=Drechslerella dactyloides TaxID=74499 RepID=A0AAD6IZ83_DREDA|nr:hypothetical protein Dda_6145 [Drechslerella dactyloides]